MIGMLLALAASASTVVPQPTIGSRQEIRNGKLYDVSLAPSCKSKQPKCKPWRREWNDSIKLLPTDIVTPEGLILREVIDA
jgi:hypothetical protein